uniref:CCHC-type domain-containing protein n=1 Tax=Acrobeloides nanus TaxID=290746 RepID=A0A914DSR8_9BILA
SKELARIAKHEKSMINNFCFNCGVKGHRETVCKKTRAGRNHVMQKFEEYKKRIEAITDRERTQYLAKTELTGQDLLSTALKKLVPHGSVTRNHLSLCEKCGEVGGHDDAKKCTNRRNPEYVDKMRLLINLYKCKHGIKDIDNEENIEDLELKDSLEDDYLTLTDSEPDTDIIVLDDDNNNEEKKSPKKDTKINRKQNIGKQKTLVAKTEVTKEPARDESEFIFEHLVERKDETNGQETDEEYNIPWEAKLEQITETNAPRTIQDVSNLVTEEILLYMKDILETVEDEIGH